MSSGDVIERVLFISPSVHVYMIPPLSSSRGHVASNWTKPPAQEIFVDQAQRIPPRLRILERSPLSETSNVQPKSASGGIIVTISLESPENGELFAAAPYTNPNAVMQAVDSARFFAITVVDSGRKAVLGIGFEDRSEAFDFGVALQEARKTLQWEAGPDKMAIDGAASGQKIPEIKRDWSLKDGEVLHVDVPNSLRRGRLEASGPSSVEDGDFLGKSRASQTAGFPGLLPPPPSAAEVKEERRKSREIIDEAKKRELAALGFDDGEFGEFQ